jgi:hypothetical protein
VSRRSKTPPPPPTCEHCHERILWATTVAGRSQALNPDPDPSGSVWAYRDAIGRLQARAATSPARHLEKLHMPHAATCPGPAAIQDPLFADKDRP